MRFIIRKLHDREQQTDFRRKLRSNLPPAEWLLWQELKNRGLDGFKFRRQHGMGNYILDFYCPEAKLAVELDGTSHENGTAKVYDLKRDDFVKAFGVKTVRFKNEEVYNHMEKVLARTRSEVGARLRGVVSSPGPLLEKEGEAWQSESRPGRTHAPAIFV